MAKWEGARPGIELGGVPVALRYRLAYSQIQVRKR